MTITLSQQTGMLLQEMAQLWDWDAEELAEALLLEALEARQQEYEKSCQAIAEGLADLDAGRTVSFEEAWVGREARRAMKTSLPKRTGILGL